MATVSVIVTESGSQWPGPVEDSENVVIVGYDTDDVIQRTRHRVDALQRQGRCVRVAVLACSEATDFAAVARRAVVAHELLKAVRVVHSGHLVLACSDDVSMDLRCELVSLAGALSDSLRGTSATVSVRFGGGADGREDGPRESLSCGVPPSEVPQALPMQGSI